MKKLLITTALVAGIGAAPAAWAACSDDIASFRDGLAERDIAVVPEDRGVLRNLMQSAGMLSDGGYEDACGSVVEAMEEYAEARADRVEEAEGGTVDPAADPAADGSDPADAAIRDTTEPSKFDAAGLVPITDGSGAWAHKDIMGAYVYGLENEYLGAVDGALLGDGGKISHLIIGTGGLLGIGDREVAVPLGQVKAMPEGDDLYLAMTQDKLEQAPDYDETDEGWVVDENDSYYAE